MQKNNLGGAVCRLSGLKAVLKGKKPSCPFPPCDDGGFGRGPDSPEDVEGFLIHAVSAGTVIQHQPPPPPGSQPLPDKTPACGRAWVGVLRALPGVLCHVGVLRELAGLPLPSFASTGTPPPEVAP